MTLVLRALSTADSEYEWIIKNDDDETDVVIVGLSGRSRGSRLGQQRLRGLLFTLRSLTPPSTQPIRKGKEHLDMTEERAEIRDRVKHDLGRPQTQHGNQRANLGPKPGQKACTLQEVNTVGTSFVGGTADTYARDH